MLKPLRRGALMGLALLWVACGCRSDRGPGFRARSRAPAPARPAATLAAVGDILLDRGVGKRIARSGLEYPFEQVRGTLAAADVTFGNLECPLSERGVRTVKPFSFRVRPDRAACLQGAGFDLLSLANNHTMDCGRAGLVETMETLRRRGIRWCGAGQDRAGAEAATVLEVRGVRLAFVGFCEFLPEGSFLRGDRPTIAFATVPAVRRAVAAARGQGDTVVASFHWGIEYASRPSRKQVVLARAAVDAGADLVLGHHPHVLQGLELRARPAGSGRRPALIAYSLGNFVFDQRDAATVQSAILRCTLDREGVSRAAVVPVQIDGHRPRPATRAESERILTRLARLSGERNTVLSGHDLVLER